MGKIRWQKVQEAEKRAKRASNAKYNGFSLTDKNGTRHYKVINGKVQDAIEGEGFDGLFRSKVHHLQPIYDKLGSVDAMIKQVNKIGKGKASVLSDKAIDKMYEERRKKHEEDDKHYSSRNSKKGINKHHLYWNAM